MTIRFLVSSIFVGLLLSGSASSADEKALTSARVVQFLDSLEEIEKLGDPFDIESPGAASPSLASKMERAAAPFSNAAAMAKAAGTHSQLAAAVKRHAFESVEDWAGAGDRIMRAVIALQMKESQTEMDASLAKARKDLESSGLPEAQRDAMLQMMQSSVQAMNAFSEVPEADKQAVAPHLSRFEGIGKKSAR